MSWYRESSKNYQLNYQGNLKEELSLRSFSRYSQDFLRQTLPFDGDFAKKVDIRVFALRKRPSGLNNLVFDFRRFLWTCKVKGFIRHIHKLPIYWNTIAFSRLQHVSVRKPGYITTSSIKYSKKNGKIEAKYRNLFRR